VTVDVLAGRPELVTGTSQILFGGMRRLSEGSVISIKNRSHSVTAEVEVGEAGAAGVIVAQGGSFGGWSLYTVDDHPRYCHNLLGLRRNADHLVHPEDRLRIIMARQ
jgi:hypothetical protein